jgi:hypothetical protein
LAAAVGRPETLVESVVQGGYSLQDHWNRQMAQRAIQSARWDFVVMQQGPSSLPTDAQELVDSVNSALPWIKGSGAKPALLTV